VEFHESQETSRHVVELVAWDEGTLEVREGERVGEVDEAADCRVVGDHGSHVLLLFGFHRFLEGGKRLLLKTEVKQVAVVRLLDEENLEGRGDGGGCLPEKFGGRDWRFQEETLNFLRELRSEVEID
jgi:hypothetical protein